METKSYRCSVNNVPEDQNKLRSTNIPLFFSVEFQKDGEPAPLVAESLLRCEKCKGYLNPYVEIIMPGFGWKCNLCDTINSVEAAFQMNDRSPNEFAHDAVKNAEYNKRTFTRNDLVNDIYELEAPESFNVKTPDPPTLIFILDVSLEAQKLNLLSSVTNILNEILGDTNYDKRTKACFIFCNEFAYLLNNDMSFSVISGEIPHVLPSTIEFSISKDSENSIAGINWTAIEKYFSEIKSIGSQPLLPLKLTASAFRSASVFLFFSALPNMGNSKLETTNSLVCKNTQYKEAAELLLRKNASVNLFIMARTSIELSVIGTLAQQTGGLEFYYPNYDGSDPVSTAKLYGDLVAYFNSDAGYGGVCRIRSNDGVVLKSVYGNFTQKGADLLGYANYNSLHMINFTLQPYNDIKKALYAQIAMIKVNKQGKRLIRVFNICIPAGGKELYSSCDANAICHALMLESFYYEGKKKLSGGEYMRGALNKIWKEVWESERRIPDALQILPSLVLSCSKSIVLRGDTSTPADFRSFYMYLYANMHRKIIDLLIYPTLLNIFDENVAPMALSKNSLAANSICLLDTGASLLFFIGKSTDPEVVKMLFSTTSSGPFLFDPPKNEISDYVANLLDYLLADRSLSPRYILVNDQEDSIYSTVFHSYLYDDKMYMLDGISEFRGSLGNLLK
ncbi:protein transport protein SEC24 [Enteropsectra breve]|nr:protein transport protein SEC24 [Enteropsectra breve]